MKTFTERQNFLRAWLKVLIPVFGVMLFGIVSKEGTGWMQWLAPALAWLLIMGFLGLFNLHTQIDATGIRYRFTPFIREHNLVWSEIESVELKSYQPLFEYGGWGIRRFWSKKRALNVWGNQGLLITLNNGKSILLGTQQPETLRSYLHVLRSSQSIRAIKTGA